jgi:hypothetical protein
MNHPEASSPGSQWLRQLVFVAVVLIGHFVAAVWPSVPRVLGQQDLGMWFLDSFAVLASSDTAMAGNDPYTDSSFDPRGRAHSYSRWWLVAGPLGLTREDNFLLGGSWVLAFFALVLSWLRPRTWTEVGWASALCLSPPILLLVNRANNDLVVFILLMAAFAWLRGASTGRIVAAIAALGLATGLKFYPMIAAAAFLVVRPPRRMLAATIAAGLVCGAVFLSVHDDFRRAVFPDEYPLSIFGAEVIGRELGASPRTIAVTALGVLTVAAIVGVRRRWTTGLADESPASLDARLLFAAGACLLVGCFVARVSYPYRWVFGILLVPWLWSRMRQGGATGRPARVAIALLLTALWMDAALVVLGNLFVAPFTQAQAAAIAHAWKITTQPLVWLLMAMLAGWLLDLLLAAVASLRTKASSTAPRS